MTSPTPEPNPWAAPGSRAPAPRHRTGWDPPPPAPVGGPPRWAPPGSDWGPAPAYYLSPAQPPRRGLGKLGIALLTTAVLVLLTGAATAVERQDDIREAELAARRAAITEELPTLKAFVEKERGLRFLREVDVELLDDDEFVERLNSPGIDEDEPEDDEDLPAYDPPSTLFALDLIGDIDDFADALGQTLDDSVQGVYEFRSKSLVIRGGELNPLTRLVLVHELTHALQDQHFDLDARDFSKTADESQVAWTALLEGDANRVDAAYRESLPRSEQDEIDRLEQAQFAGISFDGPEVIYTLLGFPYAVGPDFVDGVLDAGGQEALDQAFESSPPTTTEHILHPEEYVEKVEPLLAVPRPPADGRILDEGVLGELGLAVVLDEGGTRQVNTPAVRGWDGDYYVTYSDGDETCIRADVVMETARDRRQLLDALEEWADETDATVRSTGTRGLRLERCED